MKIHIVRNTLLQSCSYILESDSALWMIDVGDSNAILCIQKESNKPLNGLFITHCHHDHVYGLKSLLSLFPSVKVYCSPKTYQGLKNKKLNLSYMHPKYSFECDLGKNYQEIKAGLIEADGLQVEAIFTPGHSSDCTSYLIGDTIYTGDSYIPFADVFYKWPDSNKEEALQNESYLKSLIEHRHYQVFPGHWKI